MDEVSNWPDVIVFDTVEVSETEKAPKLIEDQAETIKTVGFDWNF